MRRAAIVLALAMVSVALTTGMALAAPAVTAHGASNPVAWGSISMKWTTFYVKTDTPSANAKVQVLSAAGVVANIYNGRVDARPVDGGGRTTFPAWNGKDAFGHYLPTGNYVYRIVLTAPSGTTSVSGPISVSRMRFTIDGAGTGNSPARFDRYLYAGRTLVYYKVLRPVGNTWAIMMAGVLPTSPEPTFWASPTESAPLTNPGPGAAWTGTYGTSFRSPVNSWYAWFLIGTSDETLTTANGSRIQATVLQ
jgi:hypothetical protein